MGGDCVVCDAPCRQGTDRTAQSQTWLFTWPIIWQQSTSTLFRSVLPPKLAVCASLPDSWQRQPTAVLVWFQECDLRPVLSDCLALPSLQSVSCSPLSASHVASSVSHFLCPAAGCCNLGAFLATPRFALQAGNVCASRPIANKSGSQGVELVEGSEALAVDGFRTQFEACGSWWRRYVTS